MDFDDDDFLIMACDGIFDVMTDQQLVDFVLMQEKRFENGEFDLPEDEEWEKEAAEAAGGQGLSKQEAKKAAAEKQRKRKIRFWRTIPKLIADRCSMLNSRDDKTIIFCKFDWTCTDENEDERLFDGASKLDEQFKLLLERTGHSEEPLDNRDPNAIALGNGSGTPFTGGVSAAAGSAAASTGGGAPAAGGGIRDMSGGAFNNIRTADSSKGSSSGLVEDLDDSDEDSDDNQSLLQPAPKRRKFNADEISGDLDSPAPPPVDVDMFAVKR